MSDVVRRSDEPVLAFAEKPLALLDSGRYTATYKFAVLIALIDVCVEEVDTFGRPPAQIPARRVGQRVLELLWRHAVPYSSDHGAVRYLRHSTQSNDLVEKITRFRRDYQLGPGGTTDLAGRLYPVPFGALQQEVEVTVIRMPVPKLQRFGLGSRFAEDRFLYDYNWPDEVPTSQIRAAGFDEGLYFQPGVGEWLVRLAGLLRPIVQQRWASFVAERSTDIVEPAWLERFLFGASRIDLSPLREPLVSSQDRTCFYCDGYLSPRQA